jgi:hypothetical protein
MGIPEVREAGRPRKDQEDPRGLGQEKVSNQREGEKVVAILSSPSLSMCKKTGELKYGVVCGACGSSLDSSQLAVSFWGESCHPHPIAHPAHTGLFPQTLGGITPGIPPSPVQ